MQIVTIKELVWLYWDHAKQTVNEKTVKRNRGGHYILMKVSIKQDYIKIINIYNLVTDPQNIIYDVKMNRIKGKNKELYNNSWNFNNPLQ